jgi:chloramphenicol-sensitive protein RarD
MILSYAHLSAILAFGLWGFLPFYWKALSTVSAWDLFGHRLIWSFISLVLLLIFKSKLHLLKRIWMDTKTRNMLFASALLISSNWLLYIYAVNSGRILEASMGYFLNPLLNVFLGWLFLKEKIRKFQWPAIILASFAIILVALQTSLTEFPWIAISLGVTFAFYGLIRKMANVGSQEGLTFETCILIIPVMILWKFQPTSPHTAFYLLDNPKIILLLFSGVVTCTPLVLFAYGAKRLRLSTLGFIQYLTPSLKFILGTLIFNEVLSPAKLQAFILIWIAIIWYTAESYWNSKEAQREVIVIPE